MRALTVEPGVSGSAGITDMPDPVAGEDELLVEGVAIGICGTDREIGEGRYGWAPGNEERLILGHESLGRVKHAPSDTDFREGDLVVGVVRRPDPVPCGACARGQFDMCRNGQYTERGIKERHGYGSELWTVETEYAVRLDPSLADVGMLLEPTTVVAKAWRQIEAIGNRSWFAPKTVLVTGAGPIGLLAAMIGVQRGLEVHVLDRVADGPKPRLVEALGASYHTADADEVVTKVAPDVVIEATGVPAVVFAVLGGNPTYGITCLTGVSPKGRAIRIDAGQLNREIVLENDVVVGSVNANLDDYAVGAEALAKADHEWLSGLITRRLPLDRATEALTEPGDDIKVVIDL